MHMVDILLSYVFSTNPLIPDYALLYESEATISQRESPRISQVLTHPGTSDRIVLITVPIFDASNGFLGVCGMEISSKTVSSLYAQPSAISSLTGLLVPSLTDSILPATGLECSLSPHTGILPHEKLSVSDGPGHLSYFGGQNSSYIGITSEVSLSPELAPYTIAVLLPRADYEHAILSGYIQNFWLILIPIATAICCCFLFSSRFLKPLMEGLEQICTKPVDEDHIQDLPPLSSPELVRLYERISEREQRYKDINAQLRIDNDALNETIRQLISEQSTIRQENERLAQSRKREIDPDSYQVFLEGLPTLSPMERTVFNYYMDGKKVKDIVELLGVKETTVRFHNRNIYSKLGVNSLKQLLLFAAITRQADHSKQESVDFT